MANSGMKINQNDLKALQKDIENAIEASMNETYKYYRNETPIRGGNARNKTKLTKSSTRQKISSNYDYAGRLDSGWSKQAPKGFTKPSFEFLEDSITKRFKRI